MKRFLFRKMARQFWGTRFTVRNKLYLVPEILVNDQLKFPLRAHDTIKHKINEIIQLKC